MPRPRKGSVYGHVLPDGTWHLDVRITFPDQSRSNPVCLLTSPTRRATRTPRTGTAAG